MKRNLAEAVIRIAGVIDREPWASIAFGIVCIAIVAALMLGYNSVVPAYQ